MAKTGFVCVSCCWLISLRCSLGTFDLAAPERDLHLLGASLRSGELFKFKGSTLILRNRSHEQ
jgi:hypothetical protein